MIEWVIAGVVALVLGVLGVARTYKFGPYLEKEHQVDPLPVLPEPVAAPILPPGMPPKPQYDFSTPKAAWHSVRVICDRYQLTLGQKDIVCACIYQESRFQNTAVGKNKSSTDWGIVQVNDTPGWHIGPGLQFPSVQYVIDNPEKAVKWMVSVISSSGELQPWASYTSGVYKRWLVPNSPMWALRGV